MAKTLEQIQKQIEELQREAERIRAKDVAGVVEKIKTAIKHYALTPADLFGTEIKAPAAAAAPKKTRAKRGTVQKAPVVAKYRDEAGNVWGGIGKRPRWFNAALAAGKTATDLLVK